MANLYTADNILKADQGVVAPDDLLGIKKAVDAEYGIPDLQKQFNDQYGMVNEAKANLRTTIANNNNKLIGMNAIRGANQVASETQNATIQGLADTLSALGSRLQTAQGAAADEYNIRAGEVQQKRQVMLQYPNAGIKAGDSWNKIQKKVGKEIKKQAEEDAFLKTFGVSYDDRPKGMSRSEWKKKQQKKVDDKEAYTKQVQDIELALKKKELAKPYWEPKGTSAADVEAANKDYIFNQMTSLRGMEKNKAASAGNGYYYDGYVNPNDWKDLLSQWTNAGGTTMDFFKEYKDFINPNDI